MKGQAQAPAASFTASSAAGCSPLNIQFTNTSVNAVSCQWVFGNGNTSTLTNPSNVFVNAGTYNVVLTITSANGQTSTATKQVTVIQNPVASFTAANTSACRDYGLIQFQNNSTAFDSCVWDFGDGTTSTVVSPSHAYIVSGVFTVKLQVYNKTYGCSNLQVRSSYITINPKPSANVTVDTASVCALNHLFRFSAVTSGTISSWLWSYGDGTTSSVAGNTTHTYAAAGNYIVRLILTNNFGCIDTALIQDTIKVNASPVPVVTVSDSSGCEPLAVTFKCLTSNPATYYWDFNNGLSGAGKNSATTYNAGVYYPVFTINYLNGCSRQVALDSIRVGVSPAPVYVMTNQTGCAPLTVTFTNNTPGNNTYLWVFGDGDSSTAVNPVHVFDTTGYFVVALTATSAQGCVRTYRNGWYYVNSSGPNSNFRPDITAGCAPLTVNFNNLTTGGNTWSWDFGDGATSTVQHPVHTYTTNGLYTVKLIALNTMGCTDTFVYPVQINVSSLVVNTVPAAPVVVCAPYTVYLSDNTAASAWLWNFGDGTTSSIKNPLHTYTNPGTYVIALTVWLANGGCSYTIQNFQTIIVDGTYPGYTYTVSRCPPYVVSFTDTTNGAVAWNWTYSDGGSSTLQNPTHIFPNTGNYTVNLTATSAGGCSSTYTATPGVSISGLGAIPTMFSLDTIAPYNIQFYANSTEATGWLWTFGDGSTSTSENPLHTYLTNGPFTISLTVSNDSCSFTYNYPPFTFGNGNNSGSIGGVILPPALPKVIHCAPYAVNFNNMVPGSVSWLWIFGDGTTSNVQNPVHVYDSAGVFNPMLITTNNMGAKDTAFYADTFYVAKAPSDFTITSQNSCNGIIVNVGTNGTGLTNNWNFGGGSTATGMNAMHIYPNISGTNAIRLNSVDTNGCKSFIIKSFNLDLNNPISVSLRRTCAGDTLQFLAGNMNFAQYLWDFGDGQSAAIRDPRHAYADSGVYQVVLHATDMNGCTMLFPMNYSVEVFKPVAAFTILQPYSNCSWVYTSTFNNSTGATNYLWNFGDGTTTTVFNPYHYYNNPGYHDITLTAYRNVCQSTFTIPNAIYVASLSPGFTFTSSGNCLPSTVQFTDTSTDAVKWFWDFGDGDTSSLQSPVHIYSVPPVSPVTLQVRDINGCTKTISMNVINATAANFSPAITGGCSPVSITFTDSSYNAVSWLWNFGDGTTSTDTSVTHVFNTDGTYPVSLTVTGPDGCVSVKTLNPGIDVSTPVAAFNADSLNGCAPLMVNFTNESSGATDFHWDFGDGDVSGLDNPQHIYAYKGVYTVTLIASNIYGCADTLTYTDYIVTRGSVPDFSVSALSGCAPLNIQFTDLSSGAVSWQWQFGDGTTVTGQNVSHAYTDPGSFTPTLYTMDSTGCTSVFTYPQPLVVDTMPQAAATDNNTSGCVPVTVNYDASASVANTVAWDMDDGTILNTLQVSYTYSIPGVYQVKLIAYNQNGCTDTLLMNPISVNTKPSVSFSQDNAVGCFPMPVQFNNTSSALDQPVYTWLFGNSDSSLVPSPSYVYNNPGIYTVTLIVTNAGGCSDSLVMPGLITVYDHQPPAPANWNRVTVNSGNEVQLDLSKSNEPDIDHYIIYHQNYLSGVFDSLTTIYHNQVGGSSFSWLDQNVNADLRSDNYRVATVDLCGYTLPLDSLITEATIHSAAVPGFMRVALNWSPYGGKSPAGYKVYRSSQGQPFTSIASLDPSAVDYTDTTAYCAVQYDYRVEAYGLDGSNYSSFSNIVSATPQSDIDKQEVSLIRSTVVEDKSILTEWTEPLLYPWVISRYRIYRSDDSLQYVLIADVPSVEHEFQDFNVDVHSKPYYYKVKAVTECGCSDYSDYGSSIWLKASANNQHYFLDWTPYTHWQQGVDSYKIQKLNINGLWEDIRTVPGTVTETEAE